MDNQQQGCYKTIEGVEVRQIEFAKDYYVSKRGKVYSVKSGHLKARSLVDLGGYKRLSLISDEGSSRNELVHRLVASAFIPNPLNLPEVNHINGIKDDNRVENLEWISREGNIQHAYDTGLNCVKGERNGRSILKEEDVLYIYERCLQGSQRKTLADEFGVDESTISDIISKRNWSHILKDLPSVKVRNKSKSLTEEEVRKICSMLQDGEKSSTIYDTIGRDVLTKYNLFDIKNRRVFKSVSQDYTW